MSRRGLGLMLAVGVVVAGALGSCSRVERSSLAEVAAGVATPEDFVEATVTDSRTGPPLLVELSDADETIWVSGFKAAPRRGARIWTAVLGPAAADPEVGVVYPSAGRLDVPKGGITEAGALAVILAVAFAMAVAAIVVTSAMAGVRATRRCPGCQRPVDAAWRTCPACGRSIELVGPKGATIVSSASSQPPPTPEGVDVGRADPDDSAPIDPVHAEPPSRSTRIFRRG